MTALTGGQKAKEVNIAKLQAWCATQSDEDYKQYVNNKGKLNRSGIAAVTGISLSALKNGSLKQILEDVERGLVERDVLPKPLAKKEGDEKPKRYDTSEPKRLRESNRLRELEVENQALRTEIEKLKRLQEFSETLVELGIVR